jgi:hypothetical protein
MLIIYFQKNKILITNRQGLTLKLFFFDEFSVMHNPPALLELSKSPPALLLPLTKSPPMLAIKGESLIIIFLLLSM